MTYPRVTVRGNDLPEPFDGIDDREYSTGDEAVYYPSGFEILDDIGFVVLEWHGDDEVESERRWINTDTIDSLDSVYEDER